MTRALFTKTVTNVYQYEVDVDDISTYQEMSDDLWDTFPNSSLVDTTWYVDVEEVNE
jgi:hypothetical protein